MGSRLKKDFNKIFPTEIISDILTCLPTESVLECKLVCKKWMNLIQHSQFPQMHLTRLNHPDSTESEPIYREINLRTGCESYIIIGSFNGLICIYGNQPTIRFTQHDVPVSGTLPYARGHAIIFNPVTKEYVVLPEFDCFPEYEKKGFKSIQHIHEACGFGYVASTNEYKVVSISTIEGAGARNSLEVEVYTVGSGKGWRHVGKFDFGFRFYTDFGQTHGVFLNECLHWRNRVGGMILVFDLAQENFREHISPPPMLMETHDDSREFKVLGVSGGGILYYAVRQSLEGRDLDDVWLLMKKNNDHVMKEQEEHQSWGWSKVTNLEQSKPFAFIENANIILRYDEGKLFVSTTSTWRNLVKFRAISHQVYAHKHTLVSLKELGEEGATKSLGISGQINC